MRLDRVGVVIYSRNYMDLDCRKKLDDFVAARVNCETQVRHADAEVGKERHLATNSIGPYVACEYRPWLVYVGKREIQ